MNKKIPYSVPEGYFPSLEERLNRIPFTQVKYRRVSWPYYAMAAACIASVIALFVLKDGFAKPFDEVEYEQYLYTDLIPHTDPYLVYDIISGLDGVGMTEDDAVDYLIANSRGIE